MRILYPAIRPYHRRHLAVEPPHELYVEECGNPEGIPVVFVHGGPGGGCQESDRCFFDPERYRIILFDQRGSGRSLPHASLVNNHAQGLVADMELLSVAMGVERWLILGGSWGSTLALLYAEAYPQRVLGLVLRGVFLCRDQDIRWLYQWGASQIFPEYWQEFIAPIVEYERDDLLAAYYRQLISDNEIERMAAAKAWSIWEGRCSTLRSQSAVVNHFASPHFALALARIEAHYFVNHAFLRPNQIIEDAHRLAGIPGVVVHGRYDMVCPIDQAHALRRAWPDAEYDIIREAGHSATEPGITDALVRATDAMARRLASC